MTQTAYLAHVSQHAKVWAHPGETQWGLLPSSQRLPPQSASSRQVLNPISLSFGGQRSATPRQPKGRWCTTITSLSPPTEQYCGGGGDTHPMSGITFPLLLLRTSKDRGNSDHEPNSRRHPLSGTSIHTASRPGTRRSASMMITSGV